MSLCGGTVILDNGMGLVVQGGVFDGFWQEKNVLEDVKYLLDNPDESVLGPH